MDYNQMQYPPEFQAYSTQYGGKLEIIGMPIYDTMLYTSAATVTLSFFNSMATAAGVPKTLDLTNMKTAGQLAPPYAFLLRAFKIFYKIRPESLNMAAGQYLAAINNLQQLTDTGVLSMFIGSKQYAELPLWGVPAGGGAWGLLDVSDILIGGATVDFANNGNPDPKNTLTISKPLFIEPQINFLVRLDWPAGAVTLTRNVNICVALDGDMVRPVQ